MMNRICTILLAVHLVLGAVSSWAAIAPRSTEELKKEATHIVTGEILEVVTGEGPVSIKLRVESASKGDGVKARAVIQVESWSAQLAKGPRKPGPQGLDPIPRKGDTVTAYLKATKEGGFQPVLPNGLVVREERTVARANRPKPHPNVPVAKKELLKLTGSDEGAELSRDVRILWLCGPEDHQGGEHDYIRIKELFVPMLKSIPRVTVDEAFQFPTQDQFDRADLLIQYLHLPQLTDEQFRMFKNFVDRGGSVVSIHESCIMRPIDRAEKLAECIGCSWKGNKASRWSKFGHAHPLFLNTEHAAFSGLPKSVRLNDESYWNLLTSENVEVIGAIGSVPNAEASSFAEVLNAKDIRSHAFWTFTPGKGRVFGTTTGHYTYTFYDPIYRLLLMRGVAWALNEDPAPFMPLVFHGITNDKEFVGTTDNMMNYQNRKR